MKALVSWFARNSVAANLLMAVLVVGGLLAALRVKMEIFPEFSLDVLKISVVYPGASPEEIEESICVRLEEEIQGVEGIKKVTSTAVEGLGSVMIEVRSGEDSRRVLDDVKVRVDSIENLPEEAEKPVLEEIEMREQVINVAVYGDVPELVLKRWGEKIRDEVQALDGISQVELAGARPYEVSIEVSESQLRRYGLRLESVADAVRAASIDLTGGTLKTERGEIVLRSKTQAYRGPDFEELIVLVQEDGTRIRLRDVANVVDGFEETDQASRFNNKPAVLVQVFRVGDENSLALSAAVHDYVDSLRPSLPKGVEVALWQDYAQWLKSRLELLIRNGLQGLVAVFLILALFLELRLSFWITLGIPIAFLGTLFLMPGMDESINMLTLFAFILVLGIVVDDAIVVGESIYQAQESGTIGEDGAVHGVREVTIPVIFSVLTTIAAFTPILFLPGIIGKFFGVVPRIVIPVLCFSLIESQLVLPAHLAHSYASIERLARRWPFRAWTLVRRAFGRGMTFANERIYTNVLELALRWRYATVALTIAILLLTVGAVAGGFVRFVFFPNIEGDIVAAQLTLPQGTSAEQTAAAVHKIETAASRLIEEIEAEEGAGMVVRNFLASVGEQPYLAQQRRTQTGGAKIVGANLGEVVLELTPSEQRSARALDLANRWRELCGPILGAIELSFSATVMSAGKPIDIQLSGSDVARLKAAASELEQALADYPGVFDIADSFRGGKEEIVAEVLPRAEALGLSQRDLALALRRGFYGEEVQRIQRSRDEVKVMVRYPEADRRSLADVEDMRVRTSDGREIPFDEVAEVRSQRGYASIQRTDRARTIHVTGDVDLAQSSPNEVLGAVRSDVLPKILARHPGVRASFEGQSSEQREFLGSMALLFAFALFMIYALLAIPFRSYLQPVIVMTAIPFGIVGAIWGHALLGLDLSTLSVLGIVAMAGVAVNDSLVLVDFINRKREAGLPVERAARAAGRERFRPIWLTSLTTFFGLLPLILEKSVQAQFLIPMAVSLAFGVLFCTFTSLILVPSSYLILEDLGRLWRWLYGPSSRHLAGTEYVQVPPVHSPAE